MSFQQKRHIESVYFSDNAQIDQRVQIGVHRRVGICPCSLLPVTCLLLLFVALLLAGCSRQHYRMKADKDVYSLLETGGARDCRWKLDDYRIDVDPKSRMYDRHNPDKEPMPLDDVSTHVKMHKVDGKKGSKHWHDNGVTKHVENPSWRRHLLYNDDGAVPLNIDGAVQLALLHSPEYQSEVYSHTLPNMFLSPNGLALTRVGSPVRPPLLPAYIV